MNILMMTASVGAGHIKAAEAVARELKEAAPEAQLTVVDFMSREVSTLHYLMKRIYLLMLAFVPDLYDKCYRFAGGASGGRLTDYALSLFMYRRMARLLDEYRPDLVICTHPFPEGACSLIKKFSRRRFYLAVVMTDYSLHEIWLYPRVDAYFVAIPSMAEGLKRKNFAGTRVHVTGIPVERSILSLPKKEEARRLLGLPEDKPTVLLMGGGLGLGGMDAMLDELETLDLPLSLLVVAGRNEDLELAVRARVPSSRHRLFVWGYTDRARLLMRASDVLVTKPGALTVSEAFILGLPTVLHDPIPGPEEKNAVYATEQGAAVWVHPGESLATTVCHLLTQPEQRARLSEGARRCARPYAARDIAMTLLQDCQQKSPHADA